MERSVECSSTGACTERDFWPIFHSREQQSDTVAKPVALGHGNGSSADGQIFNFLKPTRDRKRRGHTGTRTLSTMASAVHYEIPRDADHAETLTNGSSDGPL
ncbi:hypothetical protein K0M31_015399 [Melipona bicolor]|uniref:Uncharacterized protein n=1 Tax=Melipona bicolor TaxID=60889 RepID=A0AA40FFK3_9HYME|nr:hypothetical protein K0M31_015399 [Melipona bicolor]